MRNLPSLFWALILLMGGCSGPASSGVAMQPRAVVTRPAELDTATTQVSQKGAYRISYAPDVEPVIINKLHSWTVHIETVGGEAVDDLSVSVDGGMPEHNHGMPTAPSVTPNGDGNYRVEGMKFQMPGWWTVTVTVDADGQEDQATFNLLLN